MITLQEITSKCLPELLAAGNFHDIAAVVNEGRVRFQKTEIGNGLILETIGIEAGNAILDAIHSNPAFRYVVPLLDQGRLDIASDVTRGSIDMLAAAGIPSFGAAEATLIKDLAPVVTDTVSWEQCREAVEKGV